ncbi:MAG: hypothetical protein ABIV94_07390 [Acidimicrobiales bacterium]
MVSEPSWLVDWVVAAAEDHVEARRTLVSWMVAVALDFGAVFVDDAGGALGGLRHPTSVGHAKAVYKREIPSAPSRRDGGIWMYPAGIPVACNARLNRVGRAMQLLMPPFPVERLGIGGTSASEDLWAAWMGYATQSGRPALVILPVGDGEAILQRVGFTVIAERSAGSDGLPALRSWLRAQGG